MFQNIYYVSNYQYFPQNQYYFTQNQNSYNVYRQMLGTNNYFYYYNPNMPNYTTYEQHYYKTYPDSSFVANYATHAEKYSEHFLSPLKNVEKILSHSYDNTLSFTLDNRTSSRYNLDYNNQQLNRNYNRIENFESTSDDDDYDDDNESFISRTCSELNFTYLSNEED